MQHPRASLNYRTPRPSAFPRPIMSHTNVWLNKPTAAMGTSSPSNHRKEDGRRMHTVIRTAPPIMNTGQSSDGVKKMSLLRSPRWRHEKYPALVRSIRASFEDHHTAPEARTTAHVNISSARWDTRSGTRTGPLEPSGVNSLTSTPPLEVG